MMDQTEFEKCFQRMGCKNAATAENAADGIYKLASSKEIQDFEWPQDLYDSLWIALHVSWSESITSSMMNQLSSLLRIENLVWNTFKVMMNLPEFDLTKAVQSRSLNTDSVGALFRRVLMSGSLISAQQCLHWIYQNRSDFRPLIRRSLSTAMLNEGLAAPGATKVRHNDGGKSREHIAPLLEVLICIIDGFGCPLQVAHIGLLKLVLLPLHQPNEMVEWRDQIPVIQQYHSQLVRCLKALIKKSCEVVSADYQTGSLSNSYSGLCVASSSGHNPIERGSGLDIRSEFVAQTSLGSFLPFTIKNLMSYWPTTGAANTPKEVLMIHELEALVAMAISTTTSPSSSLDSPSSSINEDFLEILPIFLNRMVLSLGNGGSSDNFRTTQRALQVFKNKTILQLLNSQYNNEKSGTGSVVKLSSTISSSSSNASILSTAFTALLPALYRGGNLSWNPTVNKMTALVLRSLRSLDPMLFEICADRVVGVELQFRSSTEQNLSSNGDTSEFGRGLGQDDQKQRLISPRLLPVAPQSHVKKRMKPPVPNGFLLKSPQPLSIFKIHRDNMQAVTYPLTITGVAPWAFQVPITKTNTSSNIADSSTEGICHMLPKPIHIGTAVYKRSGSPGYRSPILPIATSMPQPLPRVPFKRLETGQLSGTVSGTSPALQATVLSPPSEGEEHEKILDFPHGHQLLLEYMEKCLPSQTEDAGKTKDDDWKVVQGALTPTLLPTLRFHDLVFGQILGQGSFGVVRYARMIVREKSRSEWPEYAVKILSAETILRECYNGAAVREMAVLQSVAHPGFARLVSCFRYTKSAYLVLEYAGCGDLHSLVVQSHPRRGPVSVPLSHLCTRFILGEVVAALLFLHEMGFAYNDLKPENILITEVGHIKIADFGACRPYTSCAIELLDSRIKALAGGTSLRNGDWRDCDCQESNAVLDDGNSDEVFIVDNRLEGTPAYMPPELLRMESCRKSGRAVDSEGDVGHNVEYEDLSDAWALGCLTSFCLHGRPLYMGTADEVLRQLDREEKEQKTHVRFNLPGKMVDSRLGDDVAVSDRSWDAANDFISSLLRRDFTERLSLREAVLHAYLTKGTLAMTDEDPSYPHPVELDPLTLHLSEPPVTLPTRASEDSGDEGYSSGIGANSTESEDHLWARRQFSILWAPMPASFSTVKEGSSVTARGFADYPYTMTSITETELESSAAFSS